LKTPSLPDLNLRHCRDFFDDFAGGLFDGVVRDLRAEPFGGNDFGSRTAGFNIVARLFGDGGSDFTGFNECTSSPSAAGLTGLVVISLPES